MIYPIMARINIRPRRERQGPCQKQRCLQRKVRRARPTGVLENECRHLANFSSVNTPSSRNPAMMARDVLQPRCSWFYNNVFLSSRLTKCCELVAPPGMEEQGGFFDAKSNQVWSSEMFLSHSSAGLQPASC